MKCLAIVLVSAVLVVGCGPQAQKTGPIFKDDVAAIDKHGGAIVLKDKDGQAMVAVAPRYQGRVMTSTADGRDGLSLGWVNRDLINSGKTLEHFNPYGGEDRLWLGPEGGQFSIYFAKGRPFDLANWYVPPAIDTQPFELVSRSDCQASLKRRISLANYSGTRFEVDVARQVRLLTPAEAWQNLKIAPQKDVKMVAYESVNSITNAGSAAWTKETGLLSIWILGMMPPTPGTTVVIPVRDGPDSELGPPVKDDYFGKVPADRLVVRNNVAYFKCDGNCRSKIGINPRRVKPIAGSYDSTNKVLTLIQFTLPQGAAGYVNSEWKIQKDPFSGDVANSYNDGPSELKPAGQFYEIESSSPGAALEPGKTLQHVHRTIHIRGTEQQLDPIAKATLGVSLKDIASAFAPAAATPPPAPGKKAPAAKKPAAPAKK